MKVRFKDVSLRILLKSSLGFAGTTPTSNTSKAAQGMRRAGTIVRSPLERRERKEASDGELRAAEVTCSASSTRHCH